jgi:hypothetical protein
MPTKLCIKQRRKGETARCFTVSDRRRHAM